MLFRREKGIYLLEDFGDLMLKHLVDQSREEGSFPGKILPFYHSVLEHLLKFQMEGHAGLDYSVCVPRKRIRQTICTVGPEPLQVFFPEFTGHPF